MYRSLAKQTTAPLVLSSIVVQVLPSWMAAIGLEALEEKSVPTQYVMQPRWRLIEPSLAVLALEAALVSHHSLGESSWLSTQITVSFPTNSLSQGEEVKPLAVP